jgi:hypothetical protein
MFHADLKNHEIIDKTTKGSFVSNRLADLSRVVDPEPHSEPYLPECFLSGAAKN